jgi:MoaA/NifB/PqqE/SkfB family radical SAM enzyme
MEKSIQLMKENGISYTVGLFSPEWIVPKTLYRKTQEPIEDTISRKQHCTCYYQIKNGKVHPCDFAQSVYSHHINDYQDSYFDLNAEMTSEERKKKLREYIEKGFYSICADCRLDEDDKGISMTAMAAEQGYLDFNKPLKGQVCKNI